MSQETIAGVTIAFEPDASEQDVHAVHAGLSTYNRRVLGDERYEPVRLLARNADGHLVAGLLGDLYFNWLYIAVLWVHEDLRGQGIGSRLMAMVEEFAIAKERTHAHVDTFDFQAPKFYQRLGYSVIGELGPYGDGHVRTYLKKTLPSPIPAGASQ